MLEHKISTTKSNGKLTDAANFYISVDPGCIFADIRAWLNFITKPSILIVRNAPFADYHETASQNMIRVRHVEKELENADCRSGRAILYEGKWG